MLKFLRKYDKWILAVGGTLLMIVFLLPQAMQQLGGDPRNKVIARFVGGSITLGERHQAQMDVEMLKMLHPSIPYALLGLDPERQQEAPHWLLLAEEARRAGFIGGPEDGAQFIDVAAVQLGRQYLQQYFGTLAPPSGEYLDFVVEQFTRDLDGQRTALLRAGRMSQTDLARVESTAMGILRLHRTYFDAPRLSDVESIALAKEQADQVAVNFAILRPMRVINEVPPATEEELAEHFEQYKDVVPGEGEYGFGYRMYPGVKVEWLPIEREKISAALTIDPIEANAHWRQARGQNPDAYSAEWSEAREAVIADLTEEKTDAILQDIERFLSGEIRKRERSLPDDGVGFKALPADWDLTRPSLRALSRRAIEQVEQTHSVDLPEFELGLATERFYIRDDVDRMRGIADAAMQRGPERIGFEDLLFECRELNPRAPYATQKGLTYGPLTDADGNRYFFVLTDVRPAQPGVLDPETMVRARLDIRRTRAMQWLLDQQEDIIAKVATEGIAALAEERNVSEIDISNGAIVARRFVNPAQTKDFDTEEIRNAILDRAETMNPRVPATQQPAGVRTLVLPSPKAHSVVVVEIIDIRPVTVESYRANVDRAEQIGERDLYFEDLREWPFSWPSVASRLQYESFSEDDEEDDAGAGDDARAEAAG